MYGNNRIKENKFMETLFRNFISIVKEAVDTVRKYDNALLDCKKTGTENK